MNKIIIRMMEGEKSEEGNDSSSPKSYHMCQTWRRQRYNVDIATNGTGSLVFIADVTANISSRIILKYRTLYSQLRFGQILQNWLDRAPQCKWIMTWSKLQEKSSCKSSEKPFKVKLKVWTLITHWLCDPVWWCAEAKLQIFCLSPKKFWT